MFFSENGGEKLYLPLPVGQPHLALRREAVLPVGTPPPQRVHHPQVSRRDRLDFRKINPVALNGRGARELDQAGAVLVVRGAEVARGQEVAELGPVDSRLVWILVLYRDRSVEARKVSRERLEKKMKEIRINARVEGRGGDGRETSIAGRVLFFLPIESGSRIRPSAPRSRAQTANYDEKLVPAQTFEAHLRRQVDLVERQDRGRLAPADAAAGRRRRRRRIRR